MRMLYFITKIICLPGAYIRCFWEHLTCRILRLMVEPVGYIRMDEACGHTEHSLPTTQFGAWLISTGPGFMNFNMGLAFFLFGYLNIKDMGITPWDSVPLFILYVASMYLGVSMLCCLFPLTEDILNYWSIAYAQGTVLNYLIAIVVFLFTPVIIFILLAMLAAAIFLKDSYTTKAVSRKLAGFIALPLAAITRLGAFLEKNCIIFFLWVAFLIWRFAFT